MNDARDYVLLAGGNLDHTAVPLLQRWISEHGGVTTPDSRIEVVGEQVFLRMPFTSLATAEEVRGGFATSIGTLPRFWRITPARPPRVVVMGTRREHCVRDLLDRAASGQMDVVAVISNHTHLADLVASYGVPFRYLPVGHDKASAEAELVGALTALRAELVVLANYMQVLSPGLCRTLDEMGIERINIHPSVLPAFVGARPYRQAAEYGVRVIGATAHYVTSVLDAGPIICQESVDVTDLPVVTEDALIERGQPAEVAALARAVRWVCARRVLAIGNKTVTFSEGR